MATVKSDVKINYYKLCLTEKLLIIKSCNDNWLLNKKSVVVSGSRHKYKLLLKGLKRNSRKNDTMDWVFLADCYIIYSGLMYMLIYLIYLHFCFLDTLKNISDDCRQHKTNSHILHVFLISKIYDDS